MQSAGAAQGVKFKPFGPLQSNYAPALAPAAQSQSMPAPGPSPNKTGKWKAKPLPANRERGVHGACVARGPVVNHGNAGNQTKGPASATISKESGGLPHGKPRDAPRKLRKIPRKFRGFCGIFG